VTFKQAPASLGACFFIRMVKTGAAGHLQKQIPQADYQQA
jgi:hypothetical protein